MGCQIKTSKFPRRENFHIPKLLAVLCLFISSGLLVVLTSLPSIATLGHKSYITHPLPPTLAQWQDHTNSGDYFDQVAKTPVGYLIWSKFPIQVYIQTPPTANDTQAQAWVNSVMETVEEWNVYLPLVVVDKPEIADITIIRQVPPLQFTRGHPPRARSAQTTYEVYKNNHILSHKFTILLSPSQTGVYLQAASRHELGHALGIWGHSNLPTDALYFSQVRNPPPISPRDVNTLKLVYQQPTHLGK
ncbi:peptidase [Anabaenopsis elenkinii]|jgi:predicted Zn-dependent protease|uniref:Peptidase n=1 Tax=Anabaenopsis elenkinii CCIBt3563 TaxID=2779889 RepID=A0A7S6RFI6_9CYAN|nr:peptidase [Anabaenopsis elenkinii]QOV23891.1 peptidase [Anabaenopsis elenkinii CCIBt3563]